MSFIFLSDSEDDNQPPLKVASQLKRPYGSRGNPIRVGDDEATELPPKKQRLSLVNLSQLPVELKSQVFSEISDRKTLLNLSLASKVFRDVFERGELIFFRSAYTEEVRKGEYSPGTAIVTITKLIKRHQEAALIVFEVTWKGIISAGQLVDAVSFLSCLGNSLDGQDGQTFDIVLLSLRTMYDHVVLEASWEAWAAAFTATAFLREEYRTDSIAKMQKYILHQAVSRRQEIMGQSVSKGQRNNAYCVLKKLQNYYEKEKRRKMKHSQREKRLNNNLIEVVQAMLDLAIQEHQLLEASNQVFELVMLNAKVKKLVPILETICSGAISENLWQEATEIVRVFKAIPDYEKVAKEPLARLRSMWYRAEGIRWASGSALF